MEMIPFELPDELAADFNRMCLENNKIRQSVLQEFSSTIFRRY